MKKSNVAKIYKGFTLIEITISIFIISLFIGGLLLPLSTSVEQKKRQETLKQLDDIKEALYAYAMVNGRLPYPDCKNNESNCNDGTEDIPSNTANNTCENCQGNLPWTTLGVSKKDTWNNFFTYRVTEEFAQNITSNTGVVFGMSTKGDINISDELNRDTPNIAQNVAAIIISHGKDFAPTNNSNYQLKNFDDDNYFIYREFSHDFDDLIAWVSPSILKSRLILSGKTLNNL